MGGILVPAPCKDANRAGNGHKHFKDLCRCVTSASGHAPGSRSGIHSGRFAAALLGADADNERFGRVGA